jgi:hypothetical protein
MECIDYTDKYLKYKTKYINLLQKGGTSEDIIGTIREYLKGFKKLGEDELISTIIPDLQKQIKKAQSSLPALNTSVLGLDVKQLQNNISSLETLVNDSLNLNLTSINTDIASLIKNELQNISELTNLQSQARTLLNEIDVSHKASHAIIEKSKEDSLERKIASNNELIKKTVDNDEKKKLQEEIDTAKKELKRLEEERKRLEAERLEEERKRLEAERLEEERKRLEAEKLKTSPDIDQFILEIIKINIDTTDLPTSFKKLNNSEVFIIIPLTYKNNQNETKKYINNMNNLKNLLFNLFGLYNILKNSKKDDKDSSYKKTSTYITNYYPGIKLLEYKESESDIKNNKNYIINIIYTILKILSDNNFGYEITEDNERFKMYMENKPQNIPEILYLFNLYSIFKKINIRKEKNKRWDENLKENKKDLLVKLNFTKEELNNDKLNNTINTIYIPFTTIKVKIIFPTPNPTQIQLESSNPIAPAPIVEAAPAPAPEAAPAPAPEAAQKLTDEELVEKFKFENLDENIQKEIKKIFKVIHSKIRLNQNRENIIKKYLNEPTTKKLTEFKEFKVSELTIVYLPPKLLKSEIINAETCTFKPNIFKINFKFPIINFVIIIFNSLINSITKILLNEHSFTNLQTHYLNPEIKSEYIKKNNNKYYYDLLYTFLILIKELTYDLQYIDTHISSNIHTIYDLLYIYLNIYLSSIVSEEQFNNKNPKYLNKNIIDTYKNLSIYYTTNTNKYQLKDINNYIDFFRIWKKFQETSIYINIPNNVNIKIINNLSNFNQTKIINIFNEEYIIPFHEQYIINNSESSKKQKLEKLFSILNIYIYSNYINSYNFVFKQYDTYDNNYYSSLIDLFKYLFDHIKIQNNSYKYMSKFISEQTNIGVDKEEFLNYIMEKYPKLTIQFLNDENNNITEDSQKINKILNNIENKKSTNNKKILNIYNDITKQTNSIILYKNNSIIYIYNFYYNFIKFLNETNIQLRNKNTISEYIKPIDTLLEYLYYNIIINKINLILYNIIINIYNENYNKELKQLLKEILSNYTYELYISNISENIIGKDNIIDKFIKQNINDIFKEIIRMVNSKYKKIIPIYERDHDDLQELKKIFLLLQKECENDINKYNQNNTIQYILNFLIILHNNKNKEQFNKYINIISKKLNIMDDDFNKITDLYNNYSKQDIYNYLRNFVLQFKEIFIREETEKNTQQIYIPNNRSSAQKKQARDMVTITINPPRSDNEKYFNLDYLANVICKYKPDFLKKTDYINDKTDFDNVLSNQNGFLNSSLVEIDENTKEILFIYEMYGVQNPIAYKYFCYNFSNIEKKIKEKFKDHKSKEFIPLLNKYIEENYKQFYEFSIQLYNNLLEQKNINNEFIKVPPEKYIEIMKAEEKNIDQNFLHILEIKPIPDS